MTLSTLRGGREGGLLDEATLLVPDTTICNPIDDFKLGVAALTDTSLSFVASDMSNPPQQSTLNGALTQAGFIQREKRKSSVHQKQSHGSITRLHQKSQQQRCPDFCDQQLRSVQNYSQILSGFTRNNC